MTSPPADSGPMTGRSIRRLADVVFFAPPGPATGAALNVAKP